MVSGLSSSTGNFLALWLNCCLVPTCPLLALLFALTLVISYQLCCLNLIFKASLFFYIQISRFSLFQAVVFFDVLFFSVYFLGLRNSWEEPPTLSLPRAREGSVSETPGAGSGPEGGPSVKDHRRKPLCFPSFHGLPTSKMKWPQLPFPALEGDYACGYCHSPGVGCPSGSLSQDAVCSQPPLHPSNTSSPAPRWSRGEKAA